MHRFSIKPKIYYGEDALDCLKIKKSKKVFIIMDPLMVEKGYGKKIEDIFKNEKDMSYEYFTNIKPDPTLDLIIDGVGHILNYSPDLIIALGGGSTIDEAKAIVFLYNTIKKEENHKHKKPVFAVIPTTSGTGSEVTNFSVITVDNKKLALVDDGFLPDFAIIDVEFTKTLPINILADTAIDALTHALEAYISKNGSDCSDALAEKAIKLIFKYLKEIFEVSDNLEARRRLHNASCIAGMAFTNASLGINHSMAHALGAIFHIPHGKANAVFLSKTIEFNYQKTYVKEKIFNLCSELGIYCDDKKNCLKGFLDELEQLFFVCKMPACVKDLEIDLDSYLKEIFNLSKRASNDRCTETNPINPSNEDFIRLFRKSYE